MGKRHGNAVPDESDRAEEGQSARSLFGLCEEGLVKGIPAGNYAVSKANKDYAVRAVALLEEGTQSWSVGALWRAVTDDPEKAHNGQLDIVMALWKNDFIQHKPQV